MPVMSTMHTCEMPSSSDKPLDTTALRQNGISILYFHYFVQPLLTPFRYIGKHHKQIIKISFD